MIAHRSSILIMMLLCNLAVCAADPDNQEEESVILLDSMSSPIRESRDAMDIVNGDSSDSDTEPDLNDDSIVTVVETNLQSELPVFEQYYYVDKLPYADQNQDDAVLWRARLRKGYEAVEAHRIIGAKSFIDLLKKRYHVYKKETLIEKVMASAGGEYVQSDDSDTYNRRLDYVKKVIKIDRSSEIGLCYAKSEDHDYLGLPLSVRKEVNHMREFPKKTHYTYREFSEWLQDRMAWIRHEGSYIVEVVPGSTKQFLAGFVEQLGNIPFTEWQLVEIDE